MSLRFSVTYIIRKTLKDIRNLLFLIKKLISSNESSSDLDFYEMRKNRHCILNGNVVFNFEEE